MDDSPDLILLLKYYLKEHQIRTAENGAMALEILKTSDFDLIMMDTEMPVMNGLDATRKIRAFEIQYQRKKTPIIAMTGNVLKEDLQKCIDSGCTAHLFKPFKKDELYSIIKSCQEHNND